jgi:hypothetical protein
MRKVALSLVAAGALLLIAAWYPHYVDKPVKDGPGPLSVHLDPGQPAPEYHSPLDWWQTHHWDVVNRGDLLQRIVYNATIRGVPTHSYVGANEIIP